MSLSIIGLLARQNLIMRKNNLQAQLLNNSRARFGMLNNLSFCGNLESAHNLENALDMENINNSIQLTAINAELDALKNINYLA